MLARTHGLAGDQLLSDLLEVRQRLAANWLKGGFQRGESLCIVAAVNTVAGLTDVATYTRVSTTHTEREARVGRMIFQIYTTLRGPEATTDQLTVSRACSEIASFNDHPAVEKETVLLLLDRAVAEVLAPATVG